MSEDMGKRLDQFAAELREEEKRPGTVEKYVRDIRTFFGWLGENKLTKEATAEWKEYLLSSGMAPVTVNSKISALNCYLQFCGYEDCKVRHLRIQRKMFRGVERELTKSEYLRLVRAAEADGKHRLALLMETICATGMRVSEISYVTVEAARVGRADIMMKGKIRTIFIPGKLCEKLLKYAKEQDTASGEIFLTRNGKALTRRQIWAEMKGLCKATGVAETKVFPHNLRHLFARTFYQSCHDVAKLADVLGHSSIETTRVYLISTGEEHARQIESLGLIQ